MRIARYGPMVAVIALLAVGCASQETGRMNSADRETAQDSTDSRETRVDTGVMQQYNINGPVF